MSSRCKSCNSILTEDELKTQWPNSYEYIDICWYCLSKELPLLFNIDIEEPNIDIELLLNN
jgi:hypothetical protein